MQFTKQSIKTTRRTDAECLVNLAQRRRWFTDNPAGGTTTPPAGQSGTGSSSAGTQNTEHMVPITRLNDVIAERDRLNGELKKFQDERAAAEQKRLEEQGQWQEAHKSVSTERDSLKPFKAQAEAYGALITETNETLIGRIPEANREMVPTDLPPDKLYAWLNKNMQRLVGSPAPSIDAGAGAAGGTGATVTVSEADRNAAATAAAHGYGVKPEDIAKIRQKTKINSGAQQ